METQPEPEPPDPETVRCPTCRAVQPWSDTCRRCKSDLRLLCDVARAYQHHRRNGLLHLSAGEPRAANRDARRCQAIVPSSETRHLLAVSALLLGDWPGAAALAGRE